MSSNEQVLNKGFAAGLKLIDYALLQSLREAARKLLYYVPIGREFQGFTGNTQTSYMCGIYMDGALVDIVKETTWTRPPVRPKIAKGKTAYLQYPYEGRSRRVTGAVNVTDDYGSNTSEAFLRSYQAPPKGLALVMTTGTEYSELLESVRHLDVLTHTYQVAAQKIASSWKSIP